MKRVDRIISIVLIPIIIIFIIYLPRFADSELHRDRFIEWLSRKEEDYSGTISIWHVVGFRPYIGSIGGFLKDNAGMIEKKHFGVYLDVEALTAEEAEKRMQNGEFPDALSFPAGFVSEERLRAFTASETEKFSRLTDIYGGMLNSDLYAVPYAASCSLIIYDPGKLNPDLDDLNAIAAGCSIDDFKNGRADCCVADARAAGDLSRALISGKGRYFEAMPIEGGTELVQFLAVSRDCADEKIPYIVEFFEKVFTDKSRKALCELGLMPLGMGDEYDYEQDYLDIAYGKLKKSDALIAGFRK